MGEGVSLELMYTVGDKLRCSTDGDDVMRVFIWRERGWQRGLRWGTKSHYQKRLIRKAVGQKQNTRRGVLEREL